MRKSAGLAAIAAVQRVGRPFGLSTGTNIMGALAHAAKMYAQRQPACMATLACDSRERHAPTIDDACEPNRHRTLAEEIGNFGR